MSDNWIVQNITRALNIWNEKLAEIWLLISQSPQTFKDGAIWTVVQSIYGSLQAVGYALLVLFFVVGVVKTTASLAEIKRPEQALRLFLRFAIFPHIIQQYLSSSARYTVYSSAIMAPSFLSAFTLITFENIKVFLV